ncbi:CHAT domain-containing protein [Sanguibacter antarcticus]|uniref:CHAT domain-containing protein n=1 Tax=Sanguibacter antarcticus TaxID=372484 RepID=A0A2A9E6T3_9MICO|nr:CHAT domain-containing protein [Sanguibacter antarcticus]PFG34035.1 CHAT domain-containing protein [Sanguibacter antarcticus]
MPARRTDGSRRPDVLAAVGAGLDEGLALSARGLPARALDVWSSALDLLDSSPDDADGSDDATGRRAHYLRARLLLSSALSRYELDGDRSATTELLSAAEHAARAARAPEVLVAIHGQRGLLALRAGALQEATAHLDDGVALVDHAEARDACILLLNRGSLNLDQGNLDQAREDLRSCAARARVLGDGLLVYKASHNLGYLEFLAGDLPLALATTEAAARAHLEAADGAVETEPVGLLDRAQMLLEAGLLTEADLHLERAAALFEERRLVHDLAEVELARARCALLADRPADALRWARSARSRFGRRKNALWRCRADLEVCRALLAEVTAGQRGDPGRLVVLAKRAENLAALAGSLGGAGGADVASGARLVAAEAYAVCGDLDRAVDLVVDLRADTVRGPLARGLQVAIVRARIAFASGDRAAGRGRVLAGQRMLAAHRAQLGSVEAVTASAVHGVRLVEMDVEAALDAGDLDGVIDAVERGRATFGGPARVRPARDEVTARLTSELRQVVERSRLLSSTATVGETVELQAQATRLREAIRQHEWQEGAGGRPLRPLSVQGIRQVVQRRPNLVVLEFVVHRGVLLLVTVDTAGERLRSVVDLPDLEERTRRLHGDLRLLSNPLVPLALRDAARRSFDVGAAWFDERMLADVPQGAEVHVVGPGQVITLPWGAFPSRRGAVTSVSPHVSRAEGSRGSGAAGLGERRVSSIAGPGLSQGRAEAEAVAALWPGGQALSGDAATCAAVAAALRESDVVHLATHGTHVVENPLFSSVRLADGPLFAYELDGLRLAPSLVVLSSCDVGQATPSLGGQTLGFASVLLRLGVGVVIASVEPVGDALARSLMPRFHALVGAGASPARALAVVGAHADEPIPFVCFTSTLT